MKQCALIDIGGGGLQEVAAAGHGALLAGARKSPRERRASVQRRGLSQRFAQRGWRGYLSANGVTQELEGRVRVNARGLSAPLPAEEQYLLAVARHYFSALRAYTEADMGQRFAGLKVMPTASKAACERSRQALFSTDRDPRPRVRGSGGGKLTGWRTAPVLGRIGSSLPAAQRRAARDQLILRRDRHE